MSYDKKYLYKLTFPNGMVYIGSTRDIKSRWANKGSNYRSLAVGKAIKEFGWGNIKREVILKLSGTVRENDIILKMESELIRAYGDRCYNVACTDAYSERKRRKEAHLHPCTVFWEIDGVTKPAREWCEEYGRTYPTVCRRIKNHGLTPKQALTFPTVPNNGYNKKPMEYWMKLGLI